MLPPNDRRVVRQLQGLDCLEVCKRSKGRDTHSDKCFRRCIVLCSGRLRMAELSTASISRRGVQKKSKTVKVPGRQRLPRQGIRHRSHRSMWLPNRTYTPGCCFTLVVRALVRALSMKRRTRQLICMIPTHGGVCGGVCACATVDESVRSRLSIGTIEGACNRCWIHLDIRATRSRCELTMTEVRSDLEARLSRYQSQTYS